MGLVDTAVVVDGAELFELEQNAFRPTLDHQRRTRIVAFGGGTGLPTVLRGLARRALPRPDKDPGIELTAVVAMSDDGGSSGKLRRSMGVLPPGDIRNCLVALAGARGPLCDLFDYRFGRREVDGHALGNLLLTALTQMHGDFLHGVRQAEAMIGARGKIFPCTLSPVELVADRADATTVVGERHLAKGAKVERVRLSPPDVQPAAGLVRAIEEADLIVFGPGSLYSSLIPNLLVQGVRDALDRSRAPKVMVMNLMTQPGETDGMGCVDHVRAVQAHAGNVLDAVLVNVAEPSEKALVRYARKGSQPVRCDRRGLIDAGVVPVEADLLRKGPNIRHDSAKIARCLVRIARSGL